KQQYQKDLATWNVTHASQVQALEQVRASVHAQSDKIRNLAFAFNDTGSDIWNALATGAQNLQGINAPFKFLLLATDFISTTQEQGSFSLAGVRVVSVFTTSSDNAFSQQSSSYWSHVVR